MLQLLVDLGSNMLWDDDEMSLNSQYYANNKYHLMVRKCLHRFAYWIIFFIPFATTKNFASSVWMQTFISKICQHVDAELYVALMSAVVPGMFKIFMVRWDFSHCIIARFGFSRDRGMHYNWKIGNSYFRILPLNYYSLYFFQTMFWNLYILQCNLIS